MSEKRLRAQKKLSAATSIAGGTLGLSGLAALALKKPMTATKLNIGAGGLGGLGAYNYASIQNQESKKRAPRQSVYVVRNKKQIKNIKSGLQPVTKGLDVMDFGLNDVHQGESVISKAMTTKQKRAGDNGAAAGQLAGPAVGYFGAQAFKGAHPAAKAGYGGMRALNSGMPSSLATAARTGGTGAKMGIKSAANGGKMLGTAVKHPWATAGTMIAGGLGGQKIGQQLAKPKQPKGMKQPKSSTFGKSKDWQNISEHQRRSRDSRRTVNRSKEVAGWGGAAIGASVAHNAAYKGVHGRPGMDRQLHNFSNALRAAPGNYKATRTHGYDAKEGARATGAALKFAAKANPHAAVATGGAAVLAGGLATAAAARGNEKKHDRAVAQLRRKRVTKAYNPEAKRHRRLDNAATSLAVAAGGTGVAAVPHARQAIGQKEVRSHAWSTKQVKVKSKTNPGKQKVVNVSAQGQPRVIQRATGLRSTNGAEVRAGLKSAGKAGALGLTAVGLAVGSDRVRSYRHGRGGTYRQLHRGS